MKRLSTVLLVEDDKNLARALVLALRGTYEIDQARTGAEALFRLDNHQYGAIILDLKLPDMAGLQVCQLLRDRGVDAPILILSGQSQILTKINLLDAGANDYLTKPFSLGELKARLRALMHNAANAAIRPRHLEAAGLVLDRQLHTVVREGKTIKLRRKEFALLECLMEHAGSVVTRTTLTRYGWHGADVPWTNTLDVHIKYLRDKLDRPFERPIIKTVHGLGYRLLLEPAAPPAESEPKTEKDKP